MLAKRLAPHDGAQEARVDALGEGGALDRLHGYAIYRISNRGTTPAPSKVQADPPDTPVQSLRGRTRGRALNAVQISAALLLVLLNGFFVAAEFSLARARLTRLDQMASDGVGGLFVTESGAGRVVRIDTGTGALDEVIDGLDAPQGIDIAPDGRLVVAEAGAGRVIAIDRDTGDYEVLADKLNIKPARGPGAPPILYAGVAVSADGAVFVSSSRSNVIYKLTPPH